MQPFKAEKIMKINKVLLIDDSAAVNGLNSAMLQEMGLFESIVSHTSAKEAISYLRSHENKDSQPPELILLDISMPEMDGFDFISEYKDLYFMNNGSDKPLIALVSDFLDSKNLDRSKHFRALGVLDQIRKPLDSEDILDLIEEHLSNS